MASLTASWRKKREDMARRRQDQERRDREEAQDGGEAAVQMARRVELKRRVRLRKKEEQGHGAYCGPDTKVCGPGTTSARAVSGW